MNTAKILAKCTNDKCTEEDGGLPYTSLMAAAAYNKVEVVRVLLESRANVDGAKHDWYRALLLAAWNGHHDVCRLLQDWGAKMNFLNMPTWSLPNVEELIDDCPR